MVEQHQGKSSEGWRHFGELWGSEVHWWRKMPRGHPECRGCWMDNLGDGQYKRWGWHRQMPPSQIESMTWRIISLWGRKYDVWCQRLWYCARQRMDVWYTLSISNRPCEQRDVDCRYPLGGQIRRPSTLPAWPMPLGRQRRGGGASQIHEHAHDTEGGAWKQICTSASWLNYTTVVMVTHNRQTNHHVSFKGCRLSSGASSVSQVMQISRKEGRPISKSTRTRMVKYTRKNNLTWRVTHREGVFGPVIHSIIDTWHYEVLWTCE